MLKAKKITLIILAVALLYPVLIWSKVLASCSFFADSEKSPQTSFQSAILDFSLFAENDFSPYVLPGIVAQKDINIINNGTLPLVYNISTINATGTLCADLSLSALLNGTEVYNGPLLDFNLSNALLATSVSDNLSLNAALSDLDAEVSSSSCFFDLSFFGNQVGDNNGFSDHEQITNTIFSGYQPTPGNHLLITKIYYHATCGHGQDSYNEWVEIYNPTTDPVELKGYQLCNKSECFSIPKQATLNPAQFAVITRHPSTWKYWAVPTDVVKIDFLGQESIFWSNQDDLIILKDQTGIILDQMNYGTPVESWPNYNEQIWNPGVEQAPFDGLLMRYPYYHDSDSIDDWQAYTPPTVHVINPNGGEIWWVGHTEKVEWEATNNNGDNNDLRINIYYSADSGKTWALLVENTDNDGIEEFRLPLLLEGGTYWVPSGTARVKVVAIGPENIMAQNYDISDNDFCPPIDYNLITPEERQVLIDMGYLVTDVHSEPIDSELQDLSVDLSHEEQTTTTETKDIATTTKKLSVMPESTDSTTATGTTETITTTPKVSATGTEPTISTSFSIATTTTEETKQE